jgi:hypothetical protein
MSGSQPTLPAANESREGDFTLRRVPVFALPTDDLPAAWSLVVAQEFDEVSVGTWGAAAVGLNGWAPVTGAFGSAAAGLGTARWMRGGLLEAVPGSVRIHTHYNPPSGEWLVDGIQQVGYGGTAHPGYGEFHLRFGVQCSAASMRGIGPFAAMRPAGGGWGCEWTLFEAPDGGVAAAAVHSDPSGRGSLALNGDRFSQVRVPVDLTALHIIDARRTFRSVAGQTVATFRYWLDNVEIGGQDAFWRDNPFAIDRLVFMATGFVAGPRARFYALPDASTPPDSWTEISFLRIWAPV